MTHIRESLPGLEFRHSPKIVSAFFDMCRAELTETIALLSDVVERGIEILMELLTHRAEAVVTLAFQEVRQR